MNQREQFTGRKVLCLFFISYQLPACLSSKLHTKSTYLIKATKTRTWGLEWWEKGKLLKDYPFGVLID